MQTNFNPESLWALNAIIGLVMFGVALELKARDFKAVLVTPRPMLIGLGAQFIVLPAFTWGLVQLIQPAPSIALGMILVAACPGGNVSNFLTHYARGNTALSVSMTAVTLLGLLSLPWSFKPVWAPLVDRYGSASFGRRKSWIVPLQLLLAATFVGASFFPPEVSLPALVGLILLMNFLTATQDIAVDGLAVDLFKGQQLGSANVAQVVGYKVGMLVGGGLLLRASANIGWRGMLLALAGLIVARNDPWGEGATVWMRRPDAEHLAEVLAGYPDRAVWRVDRDLGHGCLDAGIAGRGTLGEPRADAFGGDADQPAARRGDGRRVLPDVPFAATSP